MKKLQLTSLKCNKYITAPIMSIVLVVAILTLSLIAIYSNNDLATNDATGSDITVSEYIFASVQSPNQQFTAMIYNDDYEVRDSKADYIGKDFEIINNVTSEVIIGLDSESYYKFHTPKWVDDKYFYMLKGCGTGCEHIVLIDIDTKKVNDAITLHVPNKIDAELKGYFQDFANREWWFDGLISDIEITGIKDNHLVTLRILDMENNQSVSNETFFLKDMLE